MLADCRRVLIVDDDQELLYVLEQRLTKLGHAVRVAATAAQALELCATLPAEERPQVFLFDVVMPLMSGWELARRVRALPGFGETLFIALTGYSSETACAAADLVVRKPFAMEALHRLILTPQPDAPAH